MFGNKNKKSPKAKAGAADTLICKETKITGNVNFTGVLYIDGHIKGDITADETENSLLTIGGNGHVEGEINVPHIIVHGRVMGDVHAFEHIELMSQARIEGNVYYKLIEMAMGAEVNGKMLHKEEKTRLLSHDKESKRDNKMDDVVTNLEHSDDSSNVSASKKKAINS